jgi:hypothetical protein
MKNTNIKEVFHSHFGVSPRLDGLLMMLLKEPVLNLEWFDKFIYSNQKANKELSLMENVELIYSKEASEFIGDWLDRDTTNC